MIRTALTLFMLSGLGVYASLARGDQPSPNVTTAVYTAAAPDQVSVTPVARYGVYRYPGRYYWGPRYYGYYGYRPYYSWYYPRRYYYPGWDYGYAYGYYGTPYGAYYGPGYAYGWGY